VAEDRFEPRPGRVRLLKRRIISNNSYAHDDQGDNPGQENRLDGVLYKLWPFVSDIAIFVLKRDVKLQLTNSRELSFPENDSSWELSFLGPFVPGNFRSHYPIGLVAALLCVLNYCMFGCDFTLNIIILIILFVLNKTTQHMTAMQNYEQDQQDSTSAMMLTLLWTSQLTLYIGRPAFAACLSVFNVPITMPLRTQRLR